MTTRDPQQPRSSVHDKRLSFDNDPESYDRGRPGYPEAAFDELFTSLHVQLPTAKPSVVEIGPGTGQATGALLARGADVTAIEIGPRLAEFLRKKYSWVANLRVLTGAFEDVELAPASSDLVFAATAWKWLDPDVRVHKAHDVLRSGGTLATLSTIQIQSPLDQGFFDRTFPIYQRYRPNESWTNAPSEGEATPAEYDEFRESNLLTDVELHRYRWDQSYTTHAYEQLLRSYSDMQMMEPEAREALIQDLRSVIDSEFAGTVTRPLVMALTLGRRPVSS